MITYVLEVDQRQINNLFAKLDHDAVMRVLRPPMEESILILHSDMTDYPPPSRGRLAFKTAKQRRYFFWALRNGVINVPYVRTGKLGQSWTWRITNTPRGLFGVAGTNRKYAPWVQSQDHQARIHRGNWLTDVRALQNRQAEIGRRFREAFRAGLLR